MIAIIRWILAQGLAVELFLVFANKAEADIIFRDEWDEDASEHASFLCYHVLEQPPRGWSQGTGRITEGILRKHLPPPGPDTVIFLCGPPADDRRVGRGAQSDRPFRAGDHFPVTISADRLVTQNDSFSYWVGAWRRSPVASSARE